MEGVSVRVVPESGVSAHEGFNDACGNGICLLWGAWEGMPGWGDMGESESAPVNVVVIENDWDA